MNKFDTAEYKRSRVAYATQCTIEYFITLLITDAFLAKLLTNIGISDVLIGIISSFISLAMVMQLLSMFLMGLKIGTKKLVITLDTICNIFYMLLYLVPFMPFGKTIKTITVIISILIAYTFKYLIYSIHYNWANSNVEPTKRASYSAMKEIISLISGIIFTAVVGYIIDRYEDIGNINGAFLFIAVSVLILNICNFICIMFIRKENEKEAEERASVSEAIKYIAGNRNFKNVILMSILWEFARYFSIGFMGVFKTKDLAYSVFAVQIINMAASFFRMAISVPFGKYSDKNTYAKGMRMAMIIAAAGFFINIFTAKSTRFLIIIFTVLYNGSLAGINQNSFNIAYSYVDKKYVVQAMAIKNSIAGVCGFIASLAGGKVLAIVQNADNSFLGIPMLGQQLLSAISFAVTFITIVFVYKVIEKQEVKVQ